MEALKIDELVQAEVHFNGTLVRPWRIRWRGRIIPIDEVNLVHSRRDGRSKVFLFAVSNDQAAYKLEFNTESLLWRLLEVYMPT